MTLERTRVLLMKMRYKLVKIKMVKMKQSGQLSLELALENLKTELVNKELQQETEKLELYRKLISTDKLTQDIEQESKSLDS